jgi:phosphate transport system substrate-binding protein
VRLALPSWQASIVAKLYCVAVLSFGAARVFAAAITPAAADMLTLEGSTTFNARLIVPYQPEIEKLSGHNLIVIPNKSNLGILALFEQRADLGMISTSLDGEIVLMKRTMPSLPFHRLQSFEISRTRTAFAVHPSNLVRSIDAETMRRLLLGEITNWREIGGADLPIRLVFVRDGGGVALSVETELLRGKQITVLDPIRVQVGSQVVKVVAQEPGALGLAQLGILRQHNLPEITLDRPVTQQLNLVTLDEPSAAMKAVIKAVSEVAKLKLD